MDFSANFIQLYELVCKGGPLGIAAFVAVVWVWKVMPPMIARMQAQRASADKVSDGFDDVRASLRVMAKNSDATTNLLNQILLGVEEVRLGIRELKDRGL